jgi:hypothetical protein
MPVQVENKRYETNSHEAYAPAALTQTEARRLTLGWAYFRYVGFQLLSKLVLGAVYLGIVSEGARRLIPSLAQKLFKLVPWLDQLDHRIDVAHCFALFLLIGTWWSWTQLLRTWLGINPYSRATTVIVPLATVFIIVDTVFFYNATAQWNWGGAHVSFTTLLATAGWVAILIFVTFTGIQLKEELREAKS